MRRSFPRLSKREAVLLGVALVLAFSWALDGLVQSFYLERRHRLEAAIRRQAGVLAHAAGAGGEQLGIGSSTPAGGTLSGTATDPADPRGILRSLERLAQGRVRIMALGPSSTEASGSAFGSAVDIDCDGDLAQVVDYFSRVGGECAATIETFSLTAVVGPGHTVRCRATVVPARWAATGRVLMSDPTTRAGQVNAPAHPSTSEDPTSPGSPGGR